MFTAARTAIAAQYSANGLKRVPAQMQMRVIEERQQLTIVGCEAGFAVIANDDMFNPVLGYSDRALDENDMAPGFRWWLDAMNEQLAYNAAHGIPLKAVSPADAGLPESVTELMVSQWGQDTPFNDQTPTYNSGGTEVHYVTGCVATAMAQIMYFHRWPEKGKGSISYYFTPEGSDASQKLSDNLAKKPYDWDNMLPVYKGKSWTQAQRDAVSTLMKHCGYAVKMQYTRSGSGAFTHDAADVLSKRFYYNENQHYYVRETFPVDEWMEKIYFELSDRHPVLYGANKGTNGSGHEFVLDGYNKDGQVHVNWGWEGKSDGYFDIASLNGYTLGQEMVLVRKNDEDVTFQSFWGTYDGMTASYRTGKISASAYVMNFDYHTFTGNLMLMAQNLATGETVELSSKSVERIEYLNEDENGNCYYRNLDFSGINVSNALTEDGTYRIYMASFDTSKDVEPQPIRCHESNSNSYLLTINGSKISLKDEKNANWTAQTGIEQIRLSSITTNNGDGMTRVYNAAGQKVYEAPAKSFSLDDVPANGILMLKNGKTVKKVLK